MWERDFTFLKCGKESKLFDEACLHKGAFQAGGSYEAGNNEQVIPQLSVIVAESLRQLLNEGIP